MKPEDLLSKDLHSFLNNWNDKSIPKNRIVTLLDRKMALAIKLEKWFKAGVWIINRSDSEYPESLKGKLKDKVPPILFGIGDKNLLNYNYVGIVGSRNCSENDIRNTIDIAGKLHSQGFGVVSGAARGVDEFSMTGILKLKGYALGVVADGLIKKSTSSNYRNHILERRLTLISPFNPDAGFNVGNAMGRNKLIYVLSQATIVVKSETKGGTWEGANENLKNDWVPLWVVSPNNDDKTTKGNYELVKKGARFLQSQFNVSDIINAKSKSTDFQGTLFSISNENNEDGIKKVQVKRTTSLYANNYNSGSYKIKTKIRDISFYDLFIHKLSIYLKDDELGKEELIELFELTPKQIDDWLKIAVKDKLLLKKTRPVRYQMNTKVNANIE
ncbi:MAG: DNA-processing protein DprA [Aureisphaera sp.]